MTSGSAHFNDYRVIARRLERDYLPDANLSKAAWQAASRVTLADTENPQRSHPGAKSEASVRWSPEHLYVAFSCHYTELNLYLGEDAGEERWGLWNRDVAEVFLTPFPESLHRYWEFEVAPNNLWIDLAIEKLGEIRLDAGWNSGFEHATLIDEKSKLWSCEMRIPATSLGVRQIEHGMVWRINFFRCDGLGDDSQRRFLAWSPTFQLNFHVPERFGWVRMED
jgi:cellulose/xylan binding protein with CBM9 domain